MEIYRTGQIIKKCREREGLTQAELADIIQVSQSKLDHWEEGSTFPGEFMASRLIGALRMQEAEAVLFQAALGDVKAIKNKLKAEAQAHLEEQTAEIQRIHHKKKALKLCAFGVAGFILGVIFVVATGSIHNGWQFAVIIGLLVAGLPFGWDILTDKSTKTKNYREPYYIDQWQQRDNFIIATVIFVFKLIGAYLIGIFAYPLLLFYHAYKAGKRGTIYRGVMLVALIAVSLVICSIAVVIIFGMAK